MFELLTLSSSLLFYIDPTCRGCSAGYHVDLVSPAAPATALLTQCDRQLPGFLSSSAVPPAATPPSTSPRPSPPRSLLSPPSSSSAAIAPRPTVYFSFSSCCTAQQWQTLPP